MASNTPHTREHTKERARCSERLRAMDAAHAAHAERMMPDLSGVALATTTMPRRTIVQCFAWLHAGDASGCGRGRTSINFPCENVVRDMYIEDARLFLGTREVVLLSSVMVVADPGAVEQAWHTDLPRDLRRGDEPYATVFIVALTDVEYAPTQVIVGSGASGKHEDLLMGLSDPSPASGAVVVDLRLPAGSAAIIDACDVHRGGADERPTNGRSEHSRIILALTFVRKDRVREVNALVR